MFLVWCGTGSHAAVGQPELVGNKQVADNVSVPRGVQADVGSERRSPEPHLCWNGCIGQRPLEGQSVSLYFSVFVLSSVVSCIIHVWPLKLFLYRYYYYFWPTRTSHRHSILKLRKVINWLQQASRL